MKGGRKRKWTGREWGVGNENRGTNNFQTKS